jgi:hypothetical protein
MGKQERRAAYASLWVLALAFGWIEASVVVYLREASLQAATDVADFQVFQGLPASLPPHLVAMEMAREACTILLLWAVAWLAGRRSADRAGAFLLSFGIWDLTYYATLKLVTEWPDSLRAWDILFLIPLPWVGPVWAPVAVSAVFVVAGSHLFWTSDRERRYRWPDVGVLLASVLLTIAAFLFDWRAAADHRLPERFPVWLFWAGVLVGIAWFVRVERCVARKSDRRRPWVGMRVETIVPEHSNAPAEPSGAATVDDAASRKQADLGRLIWEQAEAKRRLDVLVNEAGELAERFERLAHGLSAHPRRMLIGPLDRSTEHPTQWDVLPSDPLPRIENVVTLIRSIREASAKVDELRERLILSGRADVVQQPDHFFH